MFDQILEFEQQLAEFTGAPYAIMTDCCTHAIELCLRYDQIQNCSFTAYTYLSIPMTMHKLKIQYSLIDEQWIGQYQFYNTRIWDSARILQPNMYKSGMMQCLSFGHDKPLNIGHGGAVILDDVMAYRTILKQRYDGRDLTIAPWQTQQTFRVGYHYRPAIEDAIIGSQLLNDLKMCPRDPQEKIYPDLRQIKIID